MRFSHAIPQKRREIFTVFFLLLSIFISSFPWSLHGMNWSDGGLYFHLGNRLIHGDFPYRDYVFQVGYIPIIFDAFFQSILGPNYFSSLAAALIVKIVTLLTFYCIFRQFCSRLISASICIGLGFQTPILYNWSTFYVDLFLSFSALFIVLSLNRLNKDKLFLSSLYIMIAGFSLALVLGARQSNGVLSILITLGVMSVYSLRNPQKYLQTITFPFIIGLLLGLGTLIVILLINHGLSQALQQVFLDAGEKKNVSTFVSLLDALSGGLEPKSSIKEIFKLVVIPLIISGIIFSLIQYRVASNLPYKSHINKIGMMVIPVLLIIGIIGKDLLKPSSGILAAFTNFSTYDLPRTFFTLALVGSCIFPKRSSNLLGVPNPLFSLLTALTLGTTWAMQISWPGTGYLYTTMLVPLVMLISLMSNKISTGWKRGLSLLFLSVTVGIFTIQIVSQSLVVGSNPDGILKHTQYMLDNSMTKFIKVTRNKATAFSMLKQNIKPGDSCFIYGSAPVLYTLLDCNNPTLIDTTYTDFYTLRDAQRAVSSLKINPPEWIIETNGSKPIKAIFDGSPNFYGPFNQEGPKVIHTGLQELIKSYQIVATVRDIIPGGENLENQEFDQILDLRLYKRKDEK